ncbi:MAG TPA: transposase [Clostridiaceae bacterium]|nr:transposase [Clostridiaceae bacterium]
MKKRFTVGQKLAAIKDYEAGIKLAEICRKHNINPTTFYKWKAKYEEEEAKAALSDKAKVC